jgi:hypothetical protein
MHNPLVLFDAKILEALRRAGHTHFVRQTYKRGIDHTDTNQKGAYLISHYRDESHAAIHYEALAHDPARFFYDLSIPEHLAKLEVATTQPRGYAIYSALLADQKWRPAADMKGKIKRYIATRLGWNPKGSDTVNTDLFFQFGELFITLKWGSHESKIPLSDLERL